MSMVMGRMALLQAMTVQLDQLGYRSDVAEIFCDGKVASRAGLFKLLPGLAVDLKNGYDLNGDQTCAAVRAQFGKEQPTLLICSPMCKASPFDNS